MAFRAWQHMADAKETTRGCLSNRSNMFNMDQHGSNFKILKFKCQKVSNHSIFSQYILSCLLGFPPEMRTLSILELRTCMSMHEHANTSELRTCMSMHEHANNSVNVITLERTNLSMASLYLIALQDCLRLEDT